MPAGIAALIAADGSPVEASLVSVVTGDLPRDRGGDVGCHSSVALEIVPIAAHSAGGARWRSNDGSLVAVFDGRLDDRPALLSALERDAHEYDLATASDAALAALAYRAWGDDCVLRLLGDFAFCVWDSRNRTLFCARDHFGVKPLYYARLGRTLVVSSVLRAVKRHPAFSHRLRDEAVGDLLLFGVCAEPGHTAFEEIFRVPPAHRMRYSTATGSLRLDRYWSPFGGETLRFRDEREYVECFADLLRLSVRDRLGSGRAGVLMSGGLDSGSIAATAARFVGPGAGDRVRAFTVVYGAMTDDDEWRYSSMVASSLGIGISHLSADSRQPFDGWEGDGLPPEPTLEAMTATMSDVLQAVAGFGPIALTGDGGDPVLLPSTVLGQLGDVPAATLVADLWRAWRRRLRPPVGLRSLMAAWSAGDGAIPGWLGADLLRAFDPRARWLEVANRRGGAARAAALDDVVHPWWASTFESLDPGATGCPVAVRYPFFDVRLATFALRLPSFPWCLDKHILRAAMAGLLPEDVRRRAKTPLPRSPVAPQSQWSSARALALFEATPEIARYVDVAKFGATVDGESLLGSETPAAWAAISLAMWLRASTGADRWRRKPRGPFLHYTAYGLTIASNLELPGVPLAEMDGQPDLVVTVDERARAAPGDERVRYRSPEAQEDGVPQLTVWTGPTGAQRMRYADGTEFTIDERASRIGVRWEPPLTGEDAAVYLLGPVLGFAMRLRGIVPLHASAVLIDGRAALFVGDAGTGKSTTAAAFAALGYQVLSDDLVPIGSTGDAVVAFPSHARLALWPDSASSLFGPLPLPALTPSYEKCYLDLEKGHRFHGSPAPVEVIYVLEQRVPERQPFEVRDTPATLALVALIANTYGNYLLDAAMRALEFDTLSRVVQRVPVRRIALHDRIDRLMASCQALTAVRRESTRQHL